jgi:hypothetical protein
MKQRNERVLKIQGTARNQQKAAGFLLGLFFDPEEIGDMFLRNIGWLSA